MENDNRLKMDQIEGNFLKPLPLDTNYFDNDRDDNEIQNTENVKNDNNTYMSFNQLTKSKSANVIQQKNLKQQIISILTLSSSSSSSSTSSASSTKSNKNREKISNISSTSSDSDSNSINRHDNNTNNSSSNNKNNNCILSSSCLSSSQVNSVASSSLTSSNACNNLDETKQNLCQNNDHSLGINKYIFILNAFVNGFAQLKLCADKIDYEYIIEIYWSNETKTYVKRTFDDFILFHRNLMQQFSQFFSDLNNNSKLKDSKFVNVNGLLTHHNNNLDSQHLIPILPSNIYKLNFIFQKFESLFINTILFFKYLI